MYFECLHDIYFQRGNILRYNWIHHVLRYVPGSDNKGISLENQVSSTSMKYNVLSDVNIVFILFVFILLSMKYFIIFSVKFTSTG